MVFRFSEREHAQYQGAFWQCAQVPVISTTDIFAAKPVERAAALRLCASGAAGISPTEPQCSQIRNATIAAASWSWAQAAALIWRVRRSPRRRQAAGDWRTAPVIPGGGSA